MEQKKSILKPILIFTSVMALIMLVYMLLASYFTNKNKMVVNMESVELVQLEEPQEGDPIAVVKTTLGDVRFVLYPEYSPETVKNFTELAESGYYNNTYVFHSDSGAYSAWGSPNKNGTLNEGFDESRELIKRELHQNLWPFKGAVCCLTSTVDKGFFDSLFGGGDYYSGSRFAFINTIEFTDEIKADLQSSSENTKLSDAFIENGGIPNFSQQLTIIGQVYEGIEIVEKLASLETEESENEAYKIPKDDIMILSVEIGEYSSGENNNNS